MGRYLDIARTVAGNERNEVNEISTFSNSPYPLKEEARFNRGQAVVNPAGPCPACGCGQWWQLPGNPWHCRACVPEMPLEATTLTLTCHKVQTRPAHDPARLRRMVEFACRQLTITREQLRQELEANSDLADMESGAVSVKALRQVAMTLAVMRAQKTPP